MNLGSATFDIVDHGFCACHVVADYSDDAPDPEAAVWADGERTEVALDPLTPMMRSFSIRRSCPEPSAEDGVLGGAILECGAPNKSFQIPRSRRGARLESGGTPLIRDTGGEV